MIPTRTLQPIFSPVKWSLSTCTQSSNSKVSFEKTESPSSLGSSKQTFEYASSTNPQFHTMILHLPKIMEEIPKIMKENSLSVFFSFSREENHFVLITSSSSVRSSSSESKRYIYCLHNFVTFCCSPPLTLMGPQ